MSETQETELPLETPLQSIIIRAAQMVKLYATVDSPFVLSAKPIFSQHFTDKSLFPSAPVEFDRSNSMLAPRPSCAPSRRAGKRPDWRRQAARALPRPKSRQDLAVIRIESKKPMAKVVPILGIDAAWPTWLTMKLT